jgi:hypothetical protein
MKVFQPKLQYSFKSMQIKTNKTSLNLNFIHSAAFLAQLPQPITHVIKITVGSFISKGLQQTQENK